MGSKSLLWIIEPPAGERSWLFGTMHIRDDRAYQLCHGLYPLILEADSFFGEMDLNLPAKSPSLHEYDLKSVLGEMAFEKTRHQILKSFAVDLDHYNHLHPLMIMSAISTSVLKSEHMISLDEHLWNYAKENDKPLQGLESFEEQFKILHSIPVKPLYTQLKKIASQPAALRNQTAKSLDLYVNGDIHALYKLSKSSLQNLREKVVYARNKNMSSVITHLDTSLKYFITVGAGHLSGEYGLIRLLKKAGWKIIPFRKLVS